jgi:hypothetical protein
MRTAPVLLLFVWLFSAPWVHAEPPGEAPSLAKIIEEYEHNEAELARLNGEIGSASTSQERDRLQTQIQELEGRQEELAQALEKIVGPPPAAVTPEEPVPLEEQVKSQELRHDTTLEKNVEQRLR